MTNTIEFKEDIEDANEVLDEDVGEKKAPKDDSVTVEMIVDQLADEFPEFVLAVAEENFMRGYRQALTDVDTGRKAWEEEQQNNEQE